MNSEYMSELIMIEEDVKENLEWLKVIWVVYWGVIIKKV